MQACFIGHRNIVKTENLVCLLTETIISLINNGVTSFLFGSKSDFDNLSWEIVTSLKEKFPFIKRVYVRSSFMQIDEAYKKYLLEYYEETYFPNKLKNAGKLSYVERNFEMIDKSSFCIFYYNPEYTPLMKKPCNNMVKPSRLRSGTKIAYEYAIKKKKEIINLYKK